MEEPEFSVTGDFAEWHIPNNDLVVWTCPGASRIMIQRIEPGDLTAKQACQLAQVIQQAATYIKEHQRTMATYTPQQTPQTTHPHQHAALQLQAVTNGIPTIRKIGGTWCCAHPTPGQRTTYHPPHAAAIRQANRINRKALK